MMFNKKDRVIFKSTKTKDPNVQWIRKIGIILEVTIVDDGKKGRTAFNIMVEEDNTIETVLIGAVESKA